MKRQSSFLSVIGLVLAISVSQAQEIGIDRPGNDLRPGFDLLRADPGLCRSACLDDPDCKAYTYVLPGYQGPEARCWLKSAIPAAVKNDCCISGVRTIMAAPIKGKVLAPSINLAGNWGSNIGLTYNITQQGVQFNWTDSDGVEGTGTISASGDLTTSWMDAAGSHTATGDLKMDANGQPVEITWSHGVVFKRSPDQITAVTPIQIPGPVAPAARAEMLDRLSTPMPRQEIIELLASDPAFRSRLEILAATAGMTINGLIAAPLPLPKITTLGSLQAPPSLINLWQAPIRILATEPGPMYWADGTSYAVGAMSVQALYSDADQCRFSKMMKTGVVCLRQAAWNPQWWDAFDSTPMTIQVFIDTPPEDGSYAIAVHLETSTEDSAVAAYVQNHKIDFFESLWLKPSLDGSAFIGLFNVPADAAESGLGGIPKMKNVAIVATIKVLRSPVGLFGGVTITRI
jgi:hypothetical protein